jgi:hypothetical protein
MGAAVFFLGDLADVARLVAFFAGVALWADLALDGATLGLCAAARGFFGAFGCSATGAAAWVLAVSAGMPVRRFLSAAPGGVIFALTIHV